ncbi:MAG: phosphate-selective porin OprO/OprP [Arenicella sp.]|jgi:phosphate-selective porin OprO/OprP
MKRIFALALVLMISTAASAQISAYKFGKGLNIYGKDSSFHMKFGMRFQNLFSNEWDVQDDDLGNIGNYEANFLVRRARLKFNGYAFTPKLKWKVELGISNRDIGGGADDQHNNTSRVILDAWADWNFAGNFSLKVGQGKLPGNRERVVSSGNLQFVDRSRLNSRFNIDRDMGLQLTHYFTLGENFYVKKWACITQGEGRDVTGGFNGGFDYTFRVEMLPMGKFKSKGDYVGSDLKREEKAKLSIGASYDINTNAIRQRGQNGSYIMDGNGDFVGKTLKTAFIDLMFKVKGFSVMAEFADRKSADGSFEALDDSSNVVGKFYTGKAINVQAGYLFKNNYEIALRMTSVRPDHGVSANENEYGIGFSKYFVGHKLKVQTDLNYRQKYVYGSTAPNQGSNDKLYWRVQMDLHF